MSIFRKFWEVVVQNKAGEAHEFHLLSKSEKIRLYFNLLYYITLFFGYTKILRKKKTRDRVRTSYDKNPYKKFLQSKSWTESKTLQEFVSISYYFNLVGNNISVNFLFDGKLYKGKIFEVSKHFMNHKVNTFKKIVSDEDVIVEVGCGIGTQLFSLRANGINNKMEGPPFASTTMLKSVNQS